MSVLQEHDKVSDACGEKEMSEKKKGEMKDKNGKEAWIADRKWGEKREGTR